MKRIVLAGVVLALGCAARGATDAEVRTLLDARTVEMANQVLRGDVEGFMTHVATDAVVVIRGIRMGSGDALNTDVEGATQIRQFMQYATRPPGFRVTPATFTRTRDLARQTGTWAIGDQGGTFEMAWREGGGDWEMVLWRLQADGG
jgi:hypothetical protein